MFVLRSWLLRAGTVTKAVIRRVCPSDAGWPKPEVWRKLKETVGGNLLEVRSLFAGCKADAKGAACLEALEHMHNPFLDCRSAGRNGDIGLAGCVGLGAECLRCGSAGC